MTTTTHTRHPAPGTRAGAGQSFPAKGKKVATQLAIAAVLAAFLVGTASLAQAVDTATDHGTTMYPQQEDAGDNVRKGGRGALAPNTTGRAPEGTNSATGPAVFPDGVHVTEDMVDEYWDEYWSDHFTGCYDPWWVMRGGTQSRPGQSTALSVSSSGCAPTASSTYRKPVPRTMD